MKRYMRKHAEERQLGRHMGIESCGDRWDCGLVETRVEAVQGADGDMQKSIGEGREIPGMHKERAQHRADGTAEKGTKVTPTGAHSPAP